MGKRQNLIKSLNFIYMRTVHASLVMASMCFVPSVI